MPDIEQVRVAFRLIPDESGYPPVDWERLWATPVGEKAFELDNIPFYVRGISCGDVVNCVYCGNEFVFGSIKSVSRNSTYRVFVSGVGDVDSIIAELKSLGASVEISNMQRFVAVHIPGSISIQPIADYLKKSESDAVLRYEEAAIRHSS